MMLEKEEWRAWLLEDDLEVLRRGIWNHCLLQEKMSKTSNEERDTGVDWDMDDVRMGRTWWWPVCLSIIQWPKLIRWRWKSWNKRFWWKACWCCLLPSNNSTPNSLERLQSDVNWMTEPDFVSNSWDSTSSGYEVGLKCCSKPRRREEDRQTPTTRSLQEKQLQQQTSGETRRRNSRKEYKERRRLRNKTACLEVLSIQREKRRRQAQSRGKEEKRRGRKEAEKRRPGEAKTVVANETEAASFSLFFSLLFSHVIPLLVAQSLNSTMMRTTSLPFYHFMSLFSLFSKAVFLNWDEQLFIWWDHCLLLWEEKIYKKYKRQESNKRDVMSIL